MAKRKESGIEPIASLPWPFGIALGLAGYFGIRYGIGWYLSRHGGPFFAAARPFSPDLFAPMAWIALLLCWTAALFAYLGRRRRRRLLDAQTGPDSLSAMSWRQFEMLAGEAFRRQGYAVEETGLGGADGGIDLKLRRGGRTTLVQCKQWRNRQVSVQVVREMLGVLVDQRADAVKIVALGDYTPDARRFAHGKPIELVDGAALLATVRAVQTSKASTVRILDRPAALVGSGIAGLVLIYACPLTDQPAISAAGAPIMPPMMAAAPSSLTADSGGAATALQARALPRPQIQPAVIDHTPQTDAQLREWKRKNAEAMKILEKTTPEVPLR